MSEGVRQNLEIGLLFLVIDLFITVLLLPLALRISESRRWRPMRREILDALVTCQIDTVHALKRDFESILALFLSQHIRDRQQNEVRGTEQARAALAICHSDLQRIIDVLAPAIEPSMARVIVDLMHLPAAVSQHLTRIDDYLVNLLYYDASLGPRITITNRFRQRITGDIMGIRTDVEAADRELAAIIASSSIPAQDRDALIERLDGAPSNVLIAAEALMELLVHRNWSKFDNRIYGTTEEWLRAYPLKPIQTEAIFEFGDDELLETYRRLESEG